MKIDIARQLGAVTREVISREHEGKTARIAIASRTYDTTIEDTWDAVTSAERIPRWFLPISGDLCLGGRYQLKGNASGEILVCEQPRHLKVTWEYGGDVSWVELRLDEDPAGGTRLRLEHLAYVSDELWEQFGPGAVGVGWDLTLLGLGRHLETGAAVDPHVAVAWPASDEGKAFMRGSSEGWRRASVAGGTDAEAAAAAAQRTTIAYAGAGDGDGAGGGDAPASE
jgi:uncharacterized protein YndB with AHSA1/START domain